MCFFSFIPRSKGLTSFRFTAELVRFHFTAIARYELNLTPIHPGTATAWEALFAFDTMIFLLTLIKTLKARENYPIGMNELSEIIFRDGKLFGHLIIFCKMPISVIKPGAIYYG